MDSVRTAPSVRAEAAAGPPCARIGPEATGWRTARAGLTLKSVEDRAADALVWPRHAAMCAHVKPRAAVHCMCPLVGCAMMWSA